MRINCNLFLLGCNPFVTFALPSVVTFVTSVTCFLCIYRSVVVFDLRVKKRVTRLHRREMRVTKRLQG